MSPKRLAPDIDEQMIRATVELGAREGIGKITTLKVAKACDVAEPTVYRHFDSKKNLMYQAFMLLEREIAATLQGEVFDFKHPKESTRKFADLVFDCLVEHPDETVYYSSYRHSAYYTGAESDNCQAHKDIYKMLMDGNPKLKKHSAMGYVVVWTFIVENMMNFAEKVATNKLEDSEQLRDALFMLVFGLMFDK